MGGGVFWRGSRAIGRRNRNRAAPLRKRWAAATVQCALQSLQFLIEPRRLPRMMPRVGKGTGQAADSLTPQERGSVPPECPPGAPQPRVPTPPVPPTHPFLTAARAADRRCHDATTRPRAHGAAPAPLV